jgi:hypothetical protein
MRRTVGVGVALLALAGGGCTSVKMVQRDGCWVRRTEKVFGRVHEEVGPCGRPQPRWSEDRLTRLVQECVAEADWRWQSRALEVWSRGLPYPTPQPRQDELLRACMEEVRTGMAAELDAATLRSRVAEVSGERDALRGDLERDHTKLQESQEKLTGWLGKSHDQIAEWLGQAAQKPPGNATASATSSSTSDGKASNESGSTLEAKSGSSSPPGAAPVSSASVVVPGLGPAPATLPHRKAVLASQPPRARRSSPVVSAAGLAPVPPAAPPPCAIEEAPRSPSAGEAASAPPVPSEPAGASAPPGSSGPATPPAPLEP